MQPHESGAGQGHHSHRQRRTKWASPFVTGQHGAPTEWLVRYANHVHNKGLVKDVGELLGKMLLSDCHTEVSGGVDVLIAECYEKLQLGQHQSNKTHPRVPNHGGLTVRGTPGESRGEFARGLQVLCHYLRLQVARPREWYQLWTQDW